MKMQMRAATLCVVTAITLAGLSCSRNPATFVTIGTGGVTGVYYPVGQAIANLVNQRSETYGIKASVESTGGSVYNINAVIAGDLSFGIAQSDAQHHAWHGQAEWDGAPQRALRAVFSLHPEIVTLVAAEETGIRSLSHLRGKRVNIGNPGSGNRGNAIDVLQTIFPDWETVIQTESLKAAEAPKMLQDERIDAFFYTVGHPNGAMQEATAGRRKVRFIPFAGLDELLAERPYYTRATIPLAAGMYPMAANREDVTAIGVMTTLVTSEAVAADVVYAVTREVFENLESLRAVHPALARLQPTEMLLGRTAPLHPGAERYYREAGLL